MTLLLTCVTPRFTVQASDRRLTRLDGTIHEELANKAVLWSYFGSFSYTGLAMSSRSEATDEMLMRALSKSFDRPCTAMKNLAAEATRTIGTVRLKGLRQYGDRIARRTSFVGCGFTGLHNPAAVGRSRVVDDLHPFLAVVSNAQTLAKGWRPQADPQFGVHAAFLPEDEPFLLHDAGQSVPTVIRNDLIRMIRVCLWRGVHAEAVARLLARAIREVSRTNSRVGPNVICTFVHREEVKAVSTFSLNSGPVPLIKEVMAESSYFMRLRDSKLPRYIYSPGEPDALVHYGPNFASSDVQMKGLMFGPSNLVPASTAPASGLTTF